MIHTKKTTCRICTGSQLIRFLSLGPTPLANSFLHSTEEFGEEKSYPLDVYYCEDCHLVQLLDVIDPEFLFRDYIYLILSKGEGNGLQHLFIFIHKVPAQILKHKYGHITLNI